MKIIIVGAGDVGFHLAKLLSFESQDIYLIDMNAEKLEYVSNHIDVITLKGDATSVKLLKSINIDKADIFLAVTESQNTNFTLAVIAKKLGAKKTIARIFFSWQVLFLNQASCSFCKFRMVARRPQ